jgi:hypothetical protein
MVGYTNDAVKKICDGYGVSYNLTTEYAQTVLFENGLILVHLKKFEMGDYCHEIFHLVDFALTNIGVTDEESYAYVTGEIMRRSWKIIKKKLDFCK